MTKAIVSDVRGIIKSFIISMMKFSPIGRTHLTENLVKIRNGQSCAKYSLQCLRPEVRAVLLKVAGGERIIPEYVRVVLAGCLKGYKL